MSSSAPRRSRTLVPVMIAALAVVTLIGVTIFMRQRDPPPTQTASDLARAGEDTSASPLPSPAQGSSLARPARSRQDAIAGARLASEKRREQRKESKEKIESLRDRLAVQYAAEKLDPAWAPGKQLELEKISSLPQITSSITAPKSMTVDCKSSLCRIESAFDSNGSAEDWTMLYMASVGSALPNAVVSRVQNPDGTTSVRIYGRGR